MATFFEINNSLTLSLDEIAQLLQQKESEFSSLQGRAKYDVGEGDSGDRTLIFSSETEMAELKTLCHEVVPPIIIHPN
ncbi:hypothetical protein HY948_02705 [Candidatus Gottesmanbacteria bacterium]|nr:hypothetical protein [Candidatus Gottesmanbacteria bacterium]